MDFMLGKRLPAVFVPLTLLVWFAPAYAQTAPHGVPHPHARHRAPSIAHRLELYSPRVRRSTLIYLKLRLLELREQDLDRARAAIERRLSIEELLAPPRRREDEGPHPGEPPRA